MATSKNTVPAVVADAFVRFSLGAAEISAADLWRDKGDAETLSAVQVFDLLFVAHGVTLEALRVLKDGDKRSNEESAAWDFARRFHAVRRCGVDCAAKLADANVKGDTILQRAGLRKDGTAYKPQAKRAVIQSIFNTDDWGGFVKRMAAIAAERDVAAKVAAGELSQADADAAGKRGTGTKKSDREFVIDRVGEVVKRLNRDVEKMDGSIAPDVAVKVAAMLLDVLASQGVK